MTPPLSAAILRRDRGEHLVVGPIELFFDLVYVFTIIQLSHALLHDLSWAGTLRTGVLFLAMWWAWNYTAWAMNWLDPESRVVQGLLGVLMLAALSMAVAIPDAFGADGMWFALSYVALQLLRSAFMVRAFRGADATMARNYTHLFVWSAVASAIWIAGGFVNGSTRVTVWAVAVVVDYAAPFANYVVPGRGSTPMSSWTLRPHHLAERNELVFIIALGESILIMGGTLLSTERAGLNLVAAVIGFVLLGSLWWNYFNPRVHPSDAVDAASAGRSGFAYAHAAMVAGAITVAVALELVIAHPSGHLAASTVIVAVAGPALYLLGGAWMRRAQQAGGEAAYGAAIAVLGVVGVVLYLARDSVSPLLAVVAPAVVLVGLAAVRSARPVL